MPRYLFIIHDEYYTHLDETGFDLADVEAARGYAERVIRELREEEGYDDPRLVMIVKDEKGVVLFSLPFVRVH